MLLPHTIRQLSVNIIRSYLLSVNGFYNFSIRHFFHLSNIFSLFYFHFFHICYNIDNKSQYVRRKQITKNFLSNHSNSLVFTNDKCIGCNKCISVCSAVGACVASTDENGRNRIEVDDSKCVACGACFDVCEHGAREFRDDTERFFEDLKKGEKISLLLAPAFKANYPDEYGSVLGGLKELGVNRIVSVSFGADITTWGYLNYINKHNFKGGISQPCPAVVSYIERYQPELIPKLFPVQSPIMCAAIYARKTMKITDKLALNKIAARWPAKAVAHFSFIKSK